VIRHVTTIGLGARRRCSGEPTGNCSTSEAITSNAAAPDPKVRRQCHVGLNKAFGLDTFGRTDPAHRSESARG